MDSKTPFPPRPDGIPGEVRRVERINHPMPALPPIAQTPSMTLGDVYYILFRHKLKILLCSLLGVVGAAAYYEYFPPPYQSEAKLFVRYVVTEGKTTGPDGETANMKSPDMRGETIMESETEILTSFDLSRQVAEVIGPEKILARKGGGNDLLKAAVVVHDGLQVDVPRLSSVIHVVFQHPDPGVVQPVLGGVISRYLKTHVEIHRAVGIIGDFLTQETDQLRSRLAQTEEDLRKARNKAGVISLTDSKKEFATQMARIRDELLGAQAELAERTTVLNELTKPAPGALPAPTGAPVPVPPARTDEYRGMLGRLDLLRKKEQDLLAQFTEENSRVMEVRSQLTEAEGARKKLEEEYPGLLGSTLSPAAARTPGSLDLPVESARLAALQIKIKVLNAQLDQIRAEAAGVDQMEGSISELRRRQELEEANYRYYAARLEQSRINEALGSGKVSNISQIQTPTPPALDRKKTFQFLGGILGGGIALGLAWAFVIELFLDRSVRRPIDVERMLGLPLFLSIPALDRKGKLPRVKSPPPPDPVPTDDPVTVTAPNGAAPEKSDGELALRDSDPLLHPFHETLRDRLISYFESRNLTHKPKLVAVTGLDLGSGVTTTAAGLASCLSETGEGNVLLVDMTAGQGSAQQFYRGKQVCGLEEILSVRDSAQVQDKLYVVAEEPGQDRLSRILPQRFNKLVPKLKASNFDYIIFDMPAVSQISITPRLAGFMDMVLLVIESEKTDRDLVQRATALLAQSKSHVGAILNKSKNYVPRRLHQENLGNL